MSNLSTHFVIGKRITLHARIGSGSNGNIINFDSSELYFCDDAHRLHQTLVHIKYVLIPDLARMIIDHCDDVKIIKAAIYMLNTNHRSGMAEFGLKALTLFLAKVSVLECESL